MSLPQKRFYRQRAHSNPIADHCLEYPLSPNEIDWSDLFPSIQNESSVSIDFVDVGCGYGGLLVSLSPLFPDKLILGLEIRVKVSDYVRDRIDALRKQHDGQYKNVACVRTNAMKYIPNFFGKGRLSKLFFLYPDPHFKKAKHKWRIINSNKLAEYAFVLRCGGLVYLLTDVSDLFEWMTTTFDSHPLFRRVPETDWSRDVIPQLLLGDCTEEGQKVSRNNGEKYLAVYERVSDPLCK